jgi:hypothetical protein
MSDTIARKRAAFTPRFSISALASGVGPSACSHQIENVNADGLRHFRRRRSNLPFTGELQ